MSEVVAETVASYLGGWTLLKRDVASDFDLAELVENTLPVESADRVVGEGLLDSQELYTLVIPRRTLAKRRTTSGRLTTEESDRLVRVLRVLATANQVFDGVVKSAEWLRRQNRSLGGRRPIDLLVTENGARLVETILGRIEYGVYS